MEKITYFIQSLMSESIKKKYNDFGIFVKINADMTAGCHNEIKIDLIE